MLSVSLGAATGTLASMFRRPATRLSLNLAIAATPSKALPRRQMSAVTAEVPVDAVTAAEGTAYQRMTATVEVIVSKIFPAGFGWQAASLVAGQQGFEPDSVNFFLTTGAGDFTGVLIGHSSLVMYKALAGKTNSVKGDLVIGLWLSSAAFCSGLAWQPVVNFLHDDAGCSFYSTAVGCGAVTGACFFAGLRVGRVLFKPLGLAGADYANLCGDAMLSVSIGAATGTFVGTDVSFPDNGLAPVLGVTDSMSDLQGCMRAGLSTSAGFLCMQMLQNLTLSKNANWLDPVKI
eukprot:scaffold29436_cov110-Isochrysis_galbana.AAC.1